MSSMRWDAMRKIYLTLVLRLEGAVVCWGVEMDMGVEGVES